MMSTNTGTDRVGVVGMGRMGSAILERLAAQGYSVSGWNRTAVSPDKVSFPMHSAMADLVAASDVIILSLFDDRAVVEVVNALCAFDLSGKLVVDTSTTNPKTLRGLEATICEAGARAVDAPISGGPEMVLAGKAGVFLGGADGDIQRFRPVVDAFAGRVTHVGKLGAGATAKVMNNMLLCGFWQVLKEAMLTGRAGGLGYAQMLDILSGSPAAPPAFIGRMPVLTGKSDRVGFALDGVVKDAELFSEVAQSLGVDITAIQAGLDSFRAASQQGLGQADLAVMVRAAVAQE